MPLSNNVSLSVAAFTASETASFNKMSVLIPFNNRTIGPSSRYRSSPTKECCVEVGM